MSLRTIDPKVGVVSTTDAATAATVCASDTIPDSTAVLIEVHLVGRNTSTGGIASTQFVVPAKRVSGTLTVVGSIASLLPFAAGSDAALASCAAAIDVSSNTLRLRVNGVVATTIEWLGSMRLYIN